MKELTYGFFPGGSTDPRTFKPDVESCRPDELAAHKAACEAWDRGERPVRFEVSGRVSDGAIRCGSAYGVGTYEVDMPDEEPEPGAEEEDPLFVITYGTVA